MSVLLIACLVTAAAARNAQDGCLFDGRVYNAGDVITIQPCLAQMTCEGHNSYSHAKSLGGVCPEKALRDVDGQDGCLFDGRVYSAGDVITIEPCLAQMTCEGHNSYSNVKSLGGVCPEKELRAVNGQDGCLFDGRVYSAGDVITIQPCLAQMMCEGHNSYSNVKSLGGQC